MPDTAEQIPARLESIFEKDINLAVAERLKTYLEQ